ncbi:hypothetical protein GE061_006603 [Apolygus lucorum]|uniref:Uncharacterized protein n=1 Tax=Apolygus lucorum TaxID=248454 RepID=A0A8S9WTN2_APOLU|nr:hypothetical protein GE061_006603 [Apolygus lucorum]
MRRDVNFLQDKLIQINHPEPILDTAKPSELCCNTKQHNIGIAFVNGYDAATGALANLVEFPKRTSNQVGKGITSFLDMIGGRLVGLQK